MSSDGTSTAEGGISGLQSTEAMSVPNTSMVGFGVGNVPPNNSICYSSSFVSSINASGANFHQQAAQVGGGGPHSISGEKLSDQLIQIVLYQQFEAPPSTLGGDTASAREAFNELDFNKTDRIAYRHLAHLIKEEDTDLLRSLLSDTQGSVDFAEFIQFVENVALKLRVRAAGTSVSEE